MPTDDYASTARGGLKLKGGNKPTGIEKKKKKKKAPPAAPDASTSQKETALAKALADEDATATTGAEELNEAQLRSLEEVGGDGKTASERAQEEMRRRRVCLHPSCVSCCLDPLRWGSTWMLKRIGC